MKDNKSEKRRITSARKMLKKKIDVLSLIAILTGVSIAFNSCEVDKANAKSDVETINEYDFSDIIIKDASNINYRVSLGNYKPEEDSTSFSKRTIRNNNLVRTLKKKKGR